MSSRESAEVLRVTDVIDEAMDYIRKGEYRAAADHLEEAARRARELADSQPIRTND